MSLEGKLGAAEQLRGRIHLCDVLVLSAYAIAVKHGFEGTEEEWLESLRGADGITSIYILDENESLDDVPEESAIVIDPHGDDDMDITLLLDATLSMEGYAADAKAVGDAISAIPVEVTEDGFADIIGQRQATSVKMVRSGNNVVITTTLEGGVSHVSNVVLEDGIPVKVTTDGLECAVEISGFDEE